MYRISLSAFCLHLAKLVLPQHLHSCSHVHAVRNVYRFTEEEQILEMFHIIGYFYPAIIKDLRK